MSNITVKGYDHVSFWREEDIGLIVLRSDQTGRISYKAIGELMMAIGNASVDDAVKAIAITGQNFVFCKGISDSEERKDFLGLSRALASTLGAIEKPTFALVNGDAFNFGMELALLTDSIFAAKGSRMGFDREYSFVMGGSITSYWIREFSRVEAREGYNCDTVITRENFLEDAKKNIQRARVNLLALKRKMVLRRLPEALNTEHLAYLQQLENGSNEKEKQNGGDN